MSRGRRAEGACVSSARGCRGTMAAPRGEAGGRRDGEARGGRRRTSVSTCPRPRGSGARPRRRAPGVCLEPLCGVSRRRRLGRRRGAASVLLRLSSPRRTARRAVRPPQTAPAPTSLQWGGTKFRQARAAADPERGRSAGPGLDPHHPAGGRTVLRFGRGRRGWGLFCAFCPTDAQSLKGMLRARSPSSGRSQKTSLGY